jgi:hypothetical protein
LRESTIFFWKLAMVKPPKFPVEIEVGCPVFLVTNLNPISNFGINFGPRTARAWLNLWMVDKQIFNERNNVRLSY